MIEEIVDVTIRNRRLSVTDEQRDAVIAAGRAVAVEGVAIRSDSGGMIGPDYDIRLVDALTAALQNL